MASEFARVSDNTGNGLRRNQSFLHSVRPVLLINRALGLMPVTVFRTPAGYYCVKPLQCQNWSLIVAIVAWGILVALNKWLYMGTEFDAILWWYVRLRLLVPILVLITCEQKQHLMITSLKVMEHVRLKTMPMVKELQIMGMLEIILLVTFSLWWSFLTLDEPYKILKTCVSLATDTLPLLLPVGILVQFSSQILCLNQALADFNEDISISMKERCVRDLRPIMSAQTQLQLIFSVLNEAYGLTFFWSSAGIVLELTCSVLITSARPQPHIQESVCCIIWGLLYSLPFVISAALCQTTKTQVHKTRTLRHEIKTALGSTSSNQTCRFNEIYEWDVQLRHQTMDFNASGFFNPNAELLLKITTSTLSTIVILYQLGIERSEIT